jgi:hypothetical protein
MSDVKKDLADLDAAISRVIDALSGGTFDPDTLSDLKKELRILTDMRLEISNRARNSKRPNGKRSHA